MVSIVKNNKLLSLTKHTNYHWNILSINVFRSKIRELILGEINATISEELANFTQNKIVLLHRNTTMIAHNHQHPSMANTIITHNHQHPNMANTIIAHNHQHPNMANTIIAYNHQHPSISHTRVLMIVCYYCCVWTQ